MANLQTQIILLRRNYFRWQICQQQIFCFEVFSPLAPAASSIVHSEDGAGELHVGYSAAKPRAPAGIARQSISQKRQMRMRNCAITKSQVASCELFLQLGHGRNMDGIAVDIQAANPALLGPRLTAIERKLDSVLFALAPHGRVHSEIGHVGDSFCDIWQHIPRQDVADMSAISCLGLSSEHLSQQCSAARILQTWWRHTFSRVCPVGLSCNEEAVQVAYVKEVTFNSVAFASDVGGTELELRLLRPGSKHFFRQGSTAHFQLEDEAASKIQSWCLKSSS